jgi:hypothetical protein
VKVGKMVEFKLDYAVKSELTAGQLSARLEENLKHVRGDTGFLVSKNMYVGEYDGITVTVRRLYEGMHQISDIVRELQDRTTLSDLDLVSESVYILEDL